MEKTIPFFLLGASFFGLLTLFLSKLRILKNIEAQLKAEENSLSRFSQEGRKFYTLFFKKIPGLIRWDILFQKILSKIRVLALKAENQAGFLLVQVREHARERKEQKINNEDYWQKMGKLTLKRGRKKKETPPES